MVLTGFAGVTISCCDIPKLLNQRTEYFARLQPVLAWPLSTSSMWCSMCDTNARRRDFSKPAIQQFHFSPLMGLQLRDLPQMSEGFKAGMVTKKLKANFFQIQYMMQK